MTRRVALTGVGVVHAALRGGAPALRAWLAPARADARASTATLDLAGLVDEAEARRMSRACQLAVVAARLALEDAALDDGAPLGLVLGTEFGDLPATREFVDGYLERGPAGLSALLFPNTVMNTMASATAIAVQARELSLTLDAPLVAGELAAARAAFAIGSGRAETLLAGGVDELDARMRETLGELSPAGEARGEGATLLVLEPWDAARARGARVLGEIRGAAWRALPALPGGVGRAGSRGGASRAIPAALASAGVGAGEIVGVYASASGDRARDRWERELLDHALPGRPPVTALGPTLGQHAGLGALRVAAACEADGPALVYGVARGGTEVALVVDGAAECA